LRGRSPTGRCAVLVGKFAQPRLPPSKAATELASGQRGDLVVDKNKRLCFRKRSATWKQLA
jgi:hypothetical protein